MCFGALLNDVAYHIGDAAVGELQLVTCAATRFVGKPVVKNVVHRGPCFEQVPDVGVMEIAAGHLEPGDGTHIEVVTLAVAVAVVPELTVGDFQFHLRIVAGQDAVFVAGETAVAHCQQTLLQPDAGPVFVRYLGTGKVETVDRHAPGTYHPDRLTFGSASLGHEFHPATDGTHGDVGLIPNGDIAAVVAGIDFDGVTVLGLRRGRCDALNGAVGAHANDVLRLGCQDKANQSRGCQWAHRSRKHEKVMGHCLLLSGGAVVRNRGVAWIVM